ncbi:MAG: Co2+/Mg2+ efflux protein ApaG [Planctomycetota bacterium]
MTLSAATSSHASKGSECLTHGVRVTVEPSFEPGHSIASEKRYVFSYRVRIANESDRRVKLLSRRWLIIDSSGETNIVEGDGVVGEQPVIEPGSVYQYSSWCPMPVRWGTMEGTFTMAAEPDETIRVKISRFYLVAPDDAE